jgi:signal transduction histidine kinase
MQLGARVALVTSFLMAAVLAAGAWALLLLRRSDLERDLAREAQQVAALLAASLEPLAPQDALPELERRVEWARRARDQPFQLELLEAGRQRTTDEGWASLMEAARAADAPRGLLFLDSPRKRPPIYAMAVPLHDRERGDPARQIVAFLGLKRDSRFITEEISRTAWRVFPFLVGGLLAFGVVVYLVLTSSVVARLRRLIEAIDAVSKGDLSRALLPDREDEIGSLAGRFNAMTNYLREARELEARATSARLALESRLRHSEKLATMGQLAAEIAHGLGTPLNVIDGRARALAKRPADPGEVQKNAEIISDQVARITKIIRQVLDFSRKTGPTLTQVDVVRVAHEALEFVDEMIRKQRVAAEFRTPPELPSIPGDPDEIQQVCLNLVMNALHAMPTGGTLTVTLSRVTRRKEGLALSPPEPYLLLEVADTGTGIPPADRERIFEAFFTTKETGEGTGLGLAVAKGIVKDHDGWIEVDDRPGGGAVFRVFLPISSDAPGSAEERERGESESRRILLRESRSARIE